MALIGYARVSSRGQSLDVQLDKLQHCDPIFQEKRSGMTDKRPELAECLRYVRKNDVLVVTRLDRLARSTMDLCRIAAQLNEKGTALQVLDQHIDISDATGRLLFHMLSAIAQFETELRAERQAEGIAKAQSLGVHFGRKQRLTPRQVAELQQQRHAGVRLKDLMAQYALTKSSIYRYLSCQAAD
jgi:DNA invertase Pin-like site-specific DNA recombinase